MRVGMYVTFSSVSAGLPQLVNVHFDITSWIFAFISWQIIQDECWINGGSSFEQIKECVCVCLIAERIPLCIGGSLLKTGQNGNIEGKISKYELFMLLFGNDGLTSLVYINIKHKLAG